MFVTRFAPSPTGYLHKGHAFSAITAAEAARAAGGRFLLRIEDIDRVRCRPQFEAAIYEDLAWLGLEWETPVRRQSAQFADYRAALDRLQAEGLVYRCFRTRAEQAGGIAGAPHGPLQAVRGGPLPPAEEAARLAAGAPYALRLSLDAAAARLGGFSGLSFEADGRCVQARPELGGDVVLARKDAPVAYHLAATVDDAAQGVTHVIRGLDLVEAAHVQRLLQALLGLPTPVYRHHRLILGPDGRRLAKRDRSQTLRELRARGVTPGELRAELGLG